MSALRESRPESRKRWLRRTLATLLFTGGALGVTEHAVAEHQKAKSARSTIAELMSSLEALRPKGSMDLHATLNGTLSHVAFASAPTGIGETAAAVADACGKDSETGGGDALAAEGRVHNFVRESVHRQDAADDSASAVLCIFRATETGERFERFTLVRGDAHASSQVSITRQSKAELAEMFPVDGDAPGGDLPGVPRPEGSRRVIAASVIETGHAVRIYDIARHGQSSDELSLRRDAFDREMRAAGYTSSPAVATALEDARLYLRGSDRIVVSFERMPEGTRIAINRTLLP
jgi:hypothetical protein